MSILVNDNVEDSLEENREVTYPSAKIILDATYQDYIRLLNSYDKIYDKINIMLAFVGVILATFVTVVDFNVFNGTVDKLTRLEGCLILIHFTSIIVFIILFVLCIIKSLKLMMGKSITVFKSEDVRNDNLWNEEEDIVAMWLIDKYTQCTNEIRPIMENNQKQFRKIVIYASMGKILFMIIIFLQKVGL